MSRYYCAQGDYLAAAVHLQKSIQTESGLQYQDYEPAAAELFYAAGAPDYVEDSLKWTLMANPYNLAAIEWAVKVLLLKGYVPAAERLIEWARGLAPFYPSTQRMQRVLETYQGSLATSNVSQVIHPPSPDWLRYVTRGVSNPRFWQQIVQLSERFRTDPVIQMEAGICLVKDGQPDRALSKLESVAQVLSSCGHAWAMKCWAATKAGAYGEAEDAGRRALELDPQSPTVHIVSGILFSAQAGDPQNPDYRHKLDLVIQHYRQALQLEPSYATAHNNLGNALRRVGRLDEAIEHYRRALGIKSDYTEAHNNLGIALAQQNKLQEAVDHFQQALGIRPDYAEALNNLGIALAQQNRPQEAVDHFQQALRIRPDYAEAHNNLGIALAQEDRLKEAADHFQQALRIRPDYAEARDNLRMVLTGQRRSGELR
jgi:tetratricopeptide (TPR) repeat protein